MDLGYTLKKIREKKRVSQQELADALNISQKTYSNFESCRSIPTIKQFCKLSKKLEFDLVNYLKESDIKFHTDPAEYNSNQEKKLYKLKLENYKQLIKNKDQIILLLTEKVKWLERNR